ncbi:MAG TPA: hypothetical protein VLS93_11260 [Anaeromyxobacteraceae bacterium]|nr:hypothetical protein [Anaeromyxobacteraceae bacterium]
MRYLVRNHEGQELVVPTLGDLHALYAQGFLADEDLVRSERSDRWVRAGAMPALHGVRLRRADPKKLWLLLAAAVALAAGVAILVAR